MKDQARSQSWPMTHGLDGYGNRSLVGQGIRHQSEMLDFVSHRLSKASEAVRELSQCRSWEEASGVHSKWIEGTLTDYSAQSTKVAAINVK